MPSSLQSVLRGLVLLCTATACASTPQRYRGMTAADVPDGAPVRFYPEPRARPIRGRALEWQHGMPRVVTDGRDTLIVPVGTMRQMLIPEKKGHAIGGAVAGWALAVIVAYASCPPPKRYCGEENPLPLIGGGLGALVGSRIKSDWWVTVR